MKQPEIRLLLLMSCKVVRKDYQWMTTLVPIGAQS